MTKDKESATGYPKPCFEAVEHYRQRYEKNATAENLDALAWWVEVLAVKVAQWAIEERVKQ